jgi:hypothetical protein
MTGLARSAFKLKGPLIYERPNWFKTGLMHLVTHGAYHGTRLSFWDRDIIDKGEFIADGRGLSVVPVWYPQAERIAAEWSKKGSDSVVFELLSNQPPTKCIDSHDCFRIAPGEKVEILKVWKVSLPWIERSKE